MSQLPEHAKYWPQDLVNLYVAWHEHKNKTVLNKPSWHWTLTRGDTVLARLTIAQSAISWNVKVAWLTLTPESTWLIDAVSTTSVITVIHWGMAAFVDIMTNSPITKVPFSTVTCVASHRVRTVCHGVAFMRLNNTLINIFTTKPIATVAYVALTSIFVDSINACCIQVAWNDWIFTVTNVCRKKIS